MEQKDFREILKKYLSGGASEHEVQMVENWYDEMGRQRGISGESDDAKLEEQYLTNIMEQVGKKPSPVLKVKTGSGPSRYFAAIAASVLLLIMSLLVVEEKTIAPAKGVSVDQPSLITWKHIANSSNIAERYDLPDGSFVTLKPNSNIKFATSFNDLTREVQLEGEGFFEVKPNKEKPFLVYAGDVTTKVLGTSFTVRSFSEDKHVTVVVKTGKVSVLAKSVATPSVPEEIILTPNQEMTYNRTDKVVERRIVKEPQAIVSAKEIQTLRFEDAPLKEVIEAIEKVYGVTIAYEESKFGSCTLTTSVSGGGLYNRLDIITSAIGATYELKEDRIVIKGVGCNHRKDNNQINHNQ